MTEPKTEPKELHDKIIYCQYPIIRRHNSLICANLAVAYDYYGYSFCEEHKSDSDNMFPDDSPTTIERSKRLNKLNDL